MNKQQRHTLILRLITDQNQNGLLSTREIAEQCAVSEMTIRRDLQELADAGLIKRQHGGATQPKRGLNGDSNLRQVGVLIVSELGRYSDPFFNIVLEGTDRTLQASGYRINFVHVYSEVRTVPQIRDLLQQHPVSGLILMGTPPAEIIDYIKSQVPILVSIPGALGQEYDAVLFNGYEGIRGMVDHLVGLGYRRIGFVTGRFDARKEGYSAGIAQHGLPDDPALCVCVEDRPDGWTAEVGKRGTERLMSLPQPPDAIMCASDRVAIGALQWLYQEGYRVPDDVAVTGFDDITEAAFSFPPLTTVKVHKSLLGALAAERLMRRIENEDEVPLHIYTPTSLVIRQSCGHGRL